MYHLIKTSSKAIILNDINEATTLICGLISRNYQVDIKTVSTESKLNSLVNRLNNKYKGKIYSYKYIASEDIETKYTDDIIDIFQEY